MTADRLRPPSPRESGILLHLAALRYLSASQISEFVFDASTLSPRSRIVTNRRLLGGLIRRSLVGRTPRLVGGPGGGAARPTYYLTPAGYRLARSLVPSLPLRRLHSSGTFLMRHGLMTAEILLAFRRAARAHADHELIAWECERQVALPLGATLVVPDAYLLYRVGPRKLHAFLEVDMASEHTAYFSRKIRRYLALHRSGGWRKRFPVWPLVLVVAEGAGRATQLRRVSETALSDEQRYGLAPAFAFASVEALLGTPGPLGPIWEFAGRPGRAALTPGDVAAPGAAASAALPSRAPGDASGKGGRPADEVRAHTAQESVAPAALAPGRSGEVALGERG